MSESKITPQRPGWCIHYVSKMDSDTCKAGVRYDSFDPADRTIARSPCFIKPNETPTDRAPCAHLRPPTKEEIAEHEKQMKLHMEDMGAAMEAVSPYRKTHRGKGGVKIPCPACKVGTLHFAIASNGHCHAKCSTAKCVSWME